MARVRLALTISGAVALGAFEGGVLAALINAARPFSTGDDPDLVIDAIGGASAGSMTGLLAARCLVGGFDPVEAMQEAWVSGDSIQRLLRNRGDSPLSVEKLRDLAKRLFRDDAVRGDSFQTTPVRLVMMLACLRGLGYVDLVTFDVRAEWNAEQFLEPALSSPADVALASGANEWAFPPQLLNREGAKPDYEQRGLTVPESGCLWYTDGGTLDNEPLGHTLDLTNELDENCPDDTKRVHLLIHPDPSGGPTGASWSDPKDQPTWLATLLRADHLQRTQSLFDDLRTVVKTNTRIGWLDRVITALGGALDRLPEEQRTVFADAMKEALSSINDDRSTFSSSVRSDEHSVGGGLPSDAKALVDLAIRTAVGLNGKQPVGVEVISPLGLSKAVNVPVADLLAGEVLGHFGGFFDENLRLSDFDLGYECSLKWMPEGLARCGLSDDQVQQALNAAGNAYEVKELWRQWGKTSLGGIARHHPLALAGLIGQLGRVSAHDLFAMHHSDDPNLVKR